MEGSIQANEVKPGPRSPLIKSFYDIYYSERNLTRRVNIIYHSKIQLNDTVVAKRRRGVCHLMYFSFITDVWYLNLLKRAKLEFRSMSIRTFQPWHTLHLQSPEATTHVTDLLRNSNWFLFLFFQ